MNILEIESFEDTFGRRKMRKRPKIQADDLEGLVKEASMCVEKYANNISEKDAIGDSKSGGDNGREHRKDDIFEKGQVWISWQPILLMSHCCN